MQILAGLIWGTVMAWITQPWGNGLESVCGFWCCVIGTCAVFYLFFLCRMLGAGDIKLMALCVGFLGIRDGFFVIFLGLLSAAGYGIWKLQKYGILWERMGKLANFIVRFGQDRRLRTYPGYDEAQSRIRLGPWLWIGYCIYLVTMA